MFALVATGLAIAAMICFFLALVLGTPQNPRLCAIGGLLLSAAYLIGRYPGA